MKIIEMHTDRFWKGEAGIRGLVEDKGHTWRVNLQVKEGRIRDYSCTCPEGNSYKGVCAHGEALFAYYETCVKQQEQPPVQTSPEVWSMIRQYTNGQVAGLMAGEEQGQVGLVPEMILAGRDTLKISWQVEGEKCLKIRDLSAFCDNVRHERYGEYGKTMGFYHSPLCFREDSRELLRFLLEFVDEENHSGELVLKAPLRDRFFGLVQGRTLKLWSWNQGWNLSVVNQDPKLKILVRRCGRDGVEVLFQGFLAEEEEETAARAILPGEEQLYLICEDRLICCSRQFRRVAGPFLKAMGPSRKVTASGRDLPLFYTRVLKPLEGAAKMIREDVRLEDYEPDPLQAVFRFDSPGKNQVVMEPILSYGDFHFHPVEDENLPRALCRDVPGEFRISRLISRYFRYKSQDGLRVILRDDEEALYELLREGMAQFGRLGQVEVSERMKELKVLHPPIPSIQMGYEHGWLDLKVDTEGLSLSELEGVFAAYESRKKYYRLKSGEFLALGEDGLKVVSELVRDLGITKKELRQGQIHLPAYRSLYLDSVLRKNGEIRCIRDRNFRQLLLNLDEGEREWEVQEELKPVLRDYQKEGFAWLKTLDQNGFGGILADDMGLGKTIQIIALLADTYRGEEKEKAGHTLIICPASLVYNWEQEILRFAPDLKPVLILGNGSARKELLEKLPDKGRILITSYELFRRDGARYGKMNFRYQIMDEAQYIKNAATQSARAVKGVAARTRFALTGTPVENRLEELWSIFDFLMPGFLFTGRKFHQDYEIPIHRGEQEVLERLRAMTAPFILRRLKTDVLRELPPKVEQVIYTGLEGEQKKLYTAWAKRLKDRLGNGEGELGEERFGILADLLRLRQICCDPRLGFENYDGPSAKLETCIHLVRQGIEGGHRILLFSQFTSMLELIEKRFCQEKIAYLKLTGETSKEERAKLVRRFSEGTEPVFLISLKAGGTGLNLTAADLVIHYDPWWNVAAQNQATDRTHRIGQERQVTVYQLIAKDTVEENMLTLQQSKEKLAREVISAYDGENRLSRKMLLSLLEAREES